MGCGSAQKNIENEMMIMELERVNLQMERRKNLKMLEDLDGIKRKANIIPDYIDPQFAKDKLNYLKKNQGLLIEGETNDGIPKKKKLRRRKLKKRKRKGKRKKKIHGIENIELNENQINSENNENKEIKENKDIV
jgi:hypothetical protein